MSLLCHETDRDLIYGEPLFLILSGERNVAVAHEIIAQIPMVERHVPCTLPMTVYRAESTRNFNGRYTWSGLELKEPLFSISIETAHQIIPRTAKLLCSRNSAD